MLISFTITNYRSLREEQTLNLGAENLSDVHQENLVSSGIKSKLALVRTAGLWGANASGKSNVLLALKEMQQFVIASHNYELDQAIPAYHPFLLDAESARKPVVLELEFLGRDDLRYVYHLAVAAASVIEESLIFYPGAKPARLFERIGGKIAFGAKYDGTRQIACRENQSLFGMLAQHPQCSEQLKEVFRFFRDDLHVIAPGYGLVNNELLAREGYRLFLGAMLSYADTGISKVEYSDSHLPVFYHENSSCAFGLEDESAGTRRLYEIAPMLLYGLNKSGVWIVDELDCQLHPRIAELIVMLFHDSRVNQQNAQLIFTTHNTTLMSSELFRRDQVWFTKKTDGATSLICLDEYGEVRGDTNFEKWYRQGRFEAIPEIQYNRLLEYLQTAAYTQREE